MVSDFNVVFMYLGTPEQRVYGWMLLGMLVTCLALQLLMVAAQNRKTPLKMIWEMLFVVSGLKPGVDAIRVVSGAEMGANQMIDPVMELVGTKVVELFAESIPGCILQVLALMNAKERSQRAVISILISAATAGFTSASIS
jgi:hypothetical protein